MCVTKFPKEEKILRTKTFELHFLHQNHCTGNETFQKSVKSVRLFLEMAVVTKTTFTSIFFFY